MKSVKFTVYGSPVAKGRPRFQRTHFGVRTFTPEKTAAYETLVKLSYQQQCAGEKLEGEIWANIIAFFPIPKSTSKKKREEMELLKVMHTKRPDADNVVKAILDAINGMAYDDDSQVCIVHAVKYYSEEPRVEVTLREIAEDDV